MKSENQISPSEMNFNETQFELLGALRARYQQDRDLFTNRELSHLRFMRWLQETRPANEQSSVQHYGLTRLEPSCGPAGPDTGGTPWREL